jgi:UDP-2,4-diacetamido-2,4,6-trideoxy-beta-L-altropyranose hydrolase
VVDHYGLDLAWERAMRDFVKRIWVIDDLVDRLHDCDVLLNQNLMEELEQRYLHKVPSTCRLFLGPAHALIRPEIIQAGKAARTRRTLSSILISFGSSDPTKETEKALKALTLPEFRELKRIDVVVGLSNPQKERIERLCAAYSHIKFHCQTEQMANLMAEADIAVGAGGVTAWERCIVGLPTLQISVAENQLEASRLLYKAGAIDHLGWHQQVTVQDIAAALRQYVDQPLLLERMSKAARQTMGSMNRPGGAIWQYIL